MASNTDIIRILKIGSGTSQEFGSIGRADFLIDQAAGGQELAVRFRIGVKGIINIGTDNISDHIKSGDTLTIRVASLSGWGGSWTLYPYTSFSNVTATGAITITGQGVGDNVFTITQAFIDELVSFDDAGTTSIGVRLFPDSFGFSDLISVDGWADTFSAAGGITKQGTANITALTTAGAQAGANPRAADATAFVNATATAAGGGKRLADAAATVNVTATGDGSPVLRGGVADTTSTASAIAAGGARRLGDVAATATVAATAGGSPVLRGGEANATAVVTVVAFGTKVGAAPKPGSAIVTAKALATATGGAQRPADAAATTVVLATAAGGAKRLGDATATAEVLATANGSPVLRGAVADATARVSVLVNAGARRLAVAAATAMITATATGTRLGEVLIDNETDKILGQSMESLSVISDGVNWWII